jgi:hypothetical protein
LAGTSPEGEARPLLLNAVFCAIAVDAAGSDFAEPLREPRPLDDRTMQPAAKFNARQAALRPMKFWPKTLLHF